MVHCVCKGYRGKAFSCVSSSLLQMPTILDFYVFSHWEKIQDGRKKLLYGVTLWSSGEVEFDLFDCVFVKRRHRCFRDIKTGFGEVHVLLCRLN